MQNSGALKIILCLAGGVAIAVGSGILFFPVAMYATNDIALGGAASLLSEVRGSGGAILAAGLLVVSGAFIARLRFSALLISTVLYLSYGASRLLSLALDGVPATGLLAVTALEIVIGGICLYALVRFRPDIDVDVDVDVDVGRDRAGASIGADAV
ncbi:MAG: DUF4345 domain-containing protein [bacterium]|nr:DUF4345 domain-containing protein [bacterium]